MPDEPFLRVCAREAILAGRLPTRPADGTSGSQGRGATCAVCQEKIPESELEMETEFRRDGQAPEVFHFHIRCFAAWEFERTKVPRKDS